MQDNEAYVFCKRKNKSRGNMRGYRYIKWGRIVFAIFLACFIVIIGVIFYARTNKAITQNARTYFYLQMGQFSTREESVALAKTVAQSGGSGYIVSDGDGVNYRVMAAVYASHDDAVTVRNRLLSSGKTAEIYAMKIEKSVFTASKNMKHNELCVAALENLSDIFDELYETSVSVDMAEISQNLAFVKAGKIRDNAKLVLDELPRDAIFNNIREQYKDVLLILNDIISVNSDISIKLKYAACALVNNFYINNSI